MTQEEKQLLTKDLCARLPYGVYVNCESCSAPHRIADIDFLKECVIVYHEAKEGINGIGCFGFEDIKPYLRPMSSMAKAENTEMHLVIYSARVTGEYFRITDFYNKHHFDYHGLIEKGLALEAPEGMYNK